MMVALGLTDSRWDAASAVLQLAQMHPASARPRHNQLGSNLPYPPTMGTCGLP